MGLSLGSSQTVQLDLLDKVFTTRQGIHVVVVAEIHSPTRSVGASFLYRNLNILDLFFNIEGLNTSTTPLAKRNNCSMSVHARLPCSHTPSTFPKM